MMVKSIEEFRDELRALREEMYQNAENADGKLIASWLDRLVISLEGFTENLAVIDAEVETVCGCCQEMEEKPKIGKTKEKAKPAKKKAKAKKRR